MPGIYRPRHPERTVIYRVLLHHFERFVAEYEGRFEPEYWMSRTARIIDHLKLTFAAEKPPPSHVFEKVTLMAAEAAPDYLS